MWGPRNIRIRRVKLVLRLILKWILRVGIITVKYIIRKLRNT